MALGIGDTRLGWIYLVGDGAFLRIGYARHPGQPLTSFVPAGRTPELAWMIPGTKREEGALHDVLQPAALAAACYERTNPCVTQLLDRLSQCLDDYNRRNVLLDTVGALNAGDDEPPESPMATQAYPLHLKASHTLAMKVQRATRHARLSRAGFMRLALNYYADLLLNLPADEAVKIGGAVGHGGTGMDAVGLSTPNRPPQLPRLLPPPAAPLPVMDSPTIDLGMLADFAVKPRRSEG